MSDVKKIGVDETSTAKGHKYVSVVLNMESHDVLYATPGKDASVINGFVQ